MHFTLRGGCHCANITVAFESALEPRSLQLHECQCSFCRRHGAKTTSDPRGRLEVRVRDAEEMLRYLFALGVTDFLVCRACGVFVAAVMETPCLGSLNVNTLNEREVFVRRSEPANYFRETPGERIARRARTRSPLFLRTSQ